MKMPSRYVKQELEIATPAQFEFVQTTALALWELLKEAEDTIGALKALLADAVVVEDPDECTQQTVICRFRPPDCRHRFQCEQANRRSG